MIKTITICQKDEWIWYINRSRQYDFYHTWTYHSLDVTGEPILVVFQESDDFIAFPVVKRRIEGTSWFDLTSVYGYTGPVSNKDINDLDDPVLNRFKQEFLDFLDRENIVTVFSRLHPLIGQNKLMGKFEGLTSNGTTIAIDLRLTVDQQRLNYRRSFRADMRKLRERGFTVKEGRSYVDAQLFSNIYTENMLRINAQEHYMFSAEYFYTLINSEEFKGSLFFVYTGDEPVCGTLVTCTNNILEVHLVATRTKFLCDSPAKFLIDEVSLWARKQGIEFLHFGGGFGFREDSLYDWKRGFSSMCFDYYSLRFVVKPELYRSILEWKGIEVDDTIDFFPLYRCNTLVLKRA